MSDFYHKNQRHEDVASLEAMFGPPWTPELLGSVLDHYDGNMEEAVNKLLVLESHHNGNPKPLVEKLVMSGYQRKFGSSPESPSRFFSSDSSEGGGTIAAIPKSKLKKPPPPRKVKVDVITADGYQPSTITIHKNTRRRVGTPMKLPNDFLRIPKVPSKPLFDPDTLDQLTDMDSFEAVGGTKGTPTTKFQAFRASMNIPSFSKPNASNSNTTKRRFMLQGGGGGGGGGGNTPRRTNSQDSTGSGNANGLLSKFSVPSVPKMSAPAMSMPKIPFPVKSPARENIAPKKPPTPQSPSAPPPEMFAHSNPTTPPRELFGVHTNPTTPTPTTTTSRSSAPPEEDLFAKPHEDGLWDLSMPAAAVVVGNKTNNKPVGDPESVPPEKSSSSSRWNLSGVGIGGGGSTVSKKRWSLPTMPVPMKKMSDSAVPSSQTTQGRESEKQASSASNSRWSLAFVNPMMIGSGTFNGSEEMVQEHAAASKDKQGSGTRWAMSTIASTMRSSSSTTSPSIDTLVSINDNDESNEIDAYGAIPQLEFRGVTAKQLQQLVQDMQNCCVREQWKSVETGQVLQPNQVSIYDLVKHYIIPKTRAHSCSYVEQAFGKHHYEHGLARPPKWFVCHAWSDSVMDLVQCIQQHAADRDDKDNTSNNDNNEESESAMYWICALAMNQHAVGAHVVADLDRLSDDSLLQDPRLTQKVLQVTDGMLVVIDRKDSFFSRIWCLWELFLALERRKTGELEDQYLLDIYSINDEGGVPVGLTSGMAEVDKYRSSKLEGEEDNSPSTNGQLKQDLCHQSEWSELRALRQSQFRFESCGSAMEVNLERTHASLEDDTRRIMNYIVQNKRDDNPNEAEALTVHPAYAYVNALIGGTFAGMAYRQALEDSMSDKHDALHCLSLKKVQRVLLASPITHLEVSFAGCAYFQIREALKFVESLPPSLEHLDLDYSFLDFQYAEEFAIGLGRLSENLETFKLNLSFCCKLDNLDRLWEELGSLVNLRRLCLVIQPHENLTSVDGLAVALSRLPRLESLQLEFDCFGAYSEIVERAKVGATIKNISSTYRNMLGRSPAPTPMQELSRRFDKVSELTHLDLGGAYISDASIQRLCRALTSQTQLKSLKLRFLGDFGKKVQGVESVQDLRRTLQQVRKGLKLFS